MPSKSSSQTSQPGTAAGEESVSNQQETSPAPLRVLLVEDQPADAQLVQDLLGDGSDVLIEVDHVARLDIAAERVSDQQFDLVLLDLSLPDGYGSYTLDFAEKFARDLPVVILTGIEDESLALKAIRAGAADYICKSALGDVKLAQTIECAVGRQRRLNLLAKSAPYQSVTGGRDTLHDPVTGLMSEALFKNRLEHTLACSQRSEVPFTLLALRLNELSEIQSEYAAGTLMCSAARCLSRRVRKSDSLARISRDSFGVVINGLSDLSAVNSAVGSLVMSLSGVAPLETPHFDPEEMSTSVGVSIHPDNGCDPDALLSRAMQFEFATARIGTMSGASNASA